MKIFYSGVRDCKGLRPELVIPDADLMLTFHDIHSNRGGQLRYLLRIAKDRKRTRPRKSRQADDNTDCERLRYFLRAFKQRLKALRKSRKAGPR